MNKFGYIINPKDTQLYRLAGGFNKMKLNLPIIKDEVMRISEIYDKNNCCIGEVLTIPQNANVHDVREKLLNYMQKNNLDFICLGDAIKQTDVSELKHDKLITGVQGMAYVSVMFIHQYLEKIGYKNIYEAEIVIAIDEYNQMTKEFVKYISSKANFITLTGSAIELDESLDSEIYNNFGISLGFSKDYRKLSSRWDIFINLSKNIQMKFLENKEENGILLDPFFLISTKDDFKVVNNLGLFSEDIIFFNKLNIINNVYSPQLIESLARVKNLSNDEDVMELIKEEIEKNEYLLIDV